MFYTIFLLLLFSVILLIFERKNRYAYLFVLMAIGGILSFFSMILHINMFGNYYYYNQLPLFDLDYKIYTFVVEHIQISIVSNIRMMNLGMALYILAMPLFSLEFYRSLCLTTANRNLYRIIKIFFIIPLIILVLYDPIISTHLYLIYHLSDNQLFLYELYKGVEIINKFFIFLTIVGPIFLLIKYLSTVTVHYFRKKIALFSFCLLSFNLFFYIFFYVGPFSISSDKVCRSGFWIFENIQFEKFSIYYEFPLLVFLLIVACIIILFSFHMDVSATIFLKRKIQKNIYLMNETLGEAMHSQKNLLFAMQILTKRMEQNHSIPKDCKEFYRLKNLISDSFENTARILDSLREIRCHYVYNNIVSIIDDAVNNIVPPENIKLKWEKKKYENQDLSGMYDQYHLKKAMIDILNNAIEAILKANRKNGMIQIEIVCIFRWMVVVITDNGTGIKGFNKNKIFTPHYSSKNGNLNWGLGLSYVYKVVKSHFGQIKIDSEYGKYTSFLIMLPFHQRGKVKNDKISYRR